jgi:hypothetical protein
MKGHTWIDNANAVLDNQAAWRIPVVAERSLAGICLDLKL